MNTLLTITPLKRS